MWLFYMDESGNTGARLDDPDQPIHYLAAIAVHESAIRNFETSYSQITVKYFETVSWQYDFEFKGNHLKGRGGKYFGARDAVGNELFPVSKRLRIVKELLTLISHHGAKIFYSAIDKRILSVARTKIGVAPNSASHPHQEAFALLVQQIEFWLCDQTPKAIGLLVADEQKELEQRLIDDLYRYKWLMQYNRLSMPVCQIVDSVHFVRSSNNPLIQIADLVAYILNAANAIKMDHPFRAEYSELLEIVKHSLISASTNEKTN